jgi:hypothetical protein
MVALIKTVESQSGILIGPAGNGCDNWLRMSGTDTAEIFVTEISDVNNRVYASLPQKINTPKMI